MVHVNAITTITQVVRFIDCKMYIYFQETDCETKKIISESYFADIPLPQFDQQDEFICHKPIKGENSHTVVSGKTNETKKDTEIQIFYFYLGKQKIRVFVSLIEYEEIINSCKDKDKNKKDGLEDSEGLFDADGVISTDYSGVTIYGIQDSLTGYGTLDVTLTSTNTAT